MEKIVEGVRWLQDGFIKRMVMERKLSPVILDFARTVELLLVKTCFIKNEKHLTTVRVDNSSQIDFFA